MSVKSKAPPPVYKPASTRVAAPSVYRPPQTANPSAQLKPGQNFRIETRSKPPTYCLQQVHGGLQLKASNNFRVENRPAPPVYRPQQPGVPAVQQKLPAASLQPQYQKHGFRSAEPIVQKNPRVTPTASTPPAQCSATPCVQMSKSYGKHGQLPGRLSRLTGAAAEAASIALHKWKQGKGMKGESVTKKGEDKEMEWSIVVALVKKYGGQLYHEGGYSKDELRQAHMALLSREDQEWFNLPQAPKSPPPPPKIKPVFEQEDIPMLIGAGYSQGMSIRSLARKFGRTRRQVREILGNPNNQETPEWAEVAVNRESIGSFEDGRFTI